MKQSRWWRTQPGALFVTPLAHTRSYEWCPPLSDIIGGLLESRLRLDFLHEHETLVATFSDDGTGWRAAL